MSIMATGRKGYAKEGGHWYTKTGEPKYEIIGANGKLRQTTIRDARKLDLVPSATTIMKMEAKPQLTNWLVQQGMMACITLPRIPGEDDTQFMERALEDSKQQTRKAAERGTYLHGLLETWLDTGFAPEVDEADLRFVRPTVEYLHDTFPDYTWSTESSFAHMLGGRWYGGKRDLCGTHPENRPVIGDYKCKDFAKDSKKQLAYDEHVTQLAAYGEPFLMEFTAINLFITTQPAHAGHFVPVNWTQAEIAGGRRAFHALIELWYARNDL